ncbi:hypothetical protein Csa_016135, partial [Cucumis sativus]
IGRSVIENIKYNKEVPIYVKTKLGQRRSPTLNIDLDKVGQVRDLILVGGPT